MASGIPYRFVKRRELDALKRRSARLLEQIDAARDFVKDIEGGQLDAVLTGHQDATDEDNALGTSLLSMRDQMKKIANDERQRNWSTEGLARFVDILRANNEDLKGLGQSIISNIVKYMNANQGSLYIISDAETETVTLEMIACYAYDRQKHVQKTIASGEGMVGQCVLEKAPIYITNLPADYLRITSGLGDALPKNLLIVPLMLNDKVYGAIELASFNIFEKYQRDFVGKLAESIASTVSNVRVNEQTRKLLHESQMQAEQVRAQEEEMRQNMEELSATQEEMQRVLREVEGKEAYVTQLLNVSSDSIFTFDRQLRLVTWNRAFSRTIERFGLQLEKGKAIVDWYPEHERDMQRKRWDRVFNGESFDATDSTQHNGDTFYHMMVYAPLRKDDGTIFEGAVFSKDITEMVKARQHAETTLKEAQNTAEELKAQEEELRQNMEELSATQDEMERILKEVAGKEAYVRSLLNASTDAIFTIDNQYRLVTWNNGFSDTLEKFGMKMEKGMDTLSFYAPQQKQQYQDIYDRCFKGETVEYTADSEQLGQTVYHQTTYSPLRNAAGEIQEISIFARDVTASANALKNSEEKEAYLDAVLNSSNDAIFTVDMSLNLITFNEGFRVTTDQLGMKTSRGGCILDLFTDEQDKQRQREMYARALKGETVDVTAGFGEGENRIFHNTCYSPIRKTSGEVTGVSVFGRDVTELIKAKTASETLAKESQEKTEELKAQEEELRQNMEELSSTQEEMHRIMQELEKKNHYSNELLNASDDLIYTVDRDYNLVSWNKTFADVALQSGTSISKGSNTLEWYPKGDIRQSYKKAYDRAFKGETFEMTSITAVNGADMKIKNKYKPLAGVDGEITEVVMFARIDDVREDDPAVAGKKGK